MNTYSKTRLGVLLALFAALAGCDALSNPDIVPLHVRYAPDDSLAIFSPTKLALVDQNHQLKQWIDYPRLPPAGRPTSYGLSPDGTHAVVAWNRAITYNGDPPVDRAVVTVFRVADGGATGIFELAFDPLADWTPVTLSDRGDLAIIDASELDGPNVKAFDVSLGTEVWSVPALSHPLFVPFHGAVAGVTPNRPWSADPATSAEAPPMMLRMLDAATGTLRFEVSLPSVDFVNKIIVSPDGNTIALAGGTHLPPDDHQQFWRILRSSDGAFIRDVAVPRNRSLGYAGAIDSDGMFLADMTIPEPRVTDSERIMLWEEGVALHERSTYWINSMAFSPDSRRLAIAERVDFEGDFRVQVLSVPGWEVIRELRYKEDIF